MKKPLLIKSLLLLCALIVGSSSAWATDYEEIFTIKSSDVVTNSSYTKYETTVSTRDFVITFGGNNKSVGTNSGNRSNCKLTNYSKYAVSPVTTSSIASAFACKTSISDVSKISYTFNGGSNQTNTNVYLLYSDDNDDFSQVTLTSGTQGASISSGTVYEFEEKSGYFALLFVATNSSGNWRIDDVDVTFYKTSGGGSDPSISLGSTTVNAPETAVSTTSINVTYNNLTNYIADVIFYEADGTTDATYDHSWLTAEINGSTNNLDYSMTANTGAARTAYLKVYAVGDEGDVESSLITITQAKKSVASPIFNHEGGSYMLGTNITISSEGNTIYYNMTTDGNELENPTNASTEYSAPIVLGSGTTKIKAIAYDTYGNASSVITRTYTGIATASLPFSWTGTSSAGKDELAAETGVALSLGTNYAASNAPYRLKFDGTSKYVIIYTNAKPENVYFTAKLFETTSTGSKIKVQGSNDGLTFTDIEEFTISGSANATFEFTTSNAFIATHRAVKLVMSSKDKNVAVGSIFISAIPVTITDADYATFVSDKKTDFAGTGITAYTAKVNGNSVTLTTIEKVPANTPVVVHKDVEETTTFAVPVTTADIAAVSENDLCVSDGTNAVGDNDNVYVLGNTDGIGFYKWTSNNSLSAGKVYLNVPAESRDYLTFAFEDQATGVGASLMNSEKCKVNSDIFDLQGRRVVNPTKGLYIVNGKKVIVK